MQWEHFLGGPLWERIGQAAGAGRTSEVADAGDNAYAPSCSRSSVDGSAAPVIAQALEPRLRVAQTVSIASAARLPGVLHFAMNSPLLGAGAMQKGGSYEGDVRCASCSDTCEARDILRHAESQKRKRQKEVVIALDKLLPETYRSDPVKNCAGRRSLGMEGRSLQDVLVDTVKCLRAMRARDEAGDADTGSPATEDEHTPATVSGATIRDGLKSSHSLAVMELEMPSWTVLSLSPAAQELLGDTPWGSCEGQCLVNSIVHHEDVSILEDIWSEAQSASKAYAAPPQGYPQAANTYPKVIRFSRYHSHDPVPVSSDADVSMEGAASASLGSQEAASKHSFPHPFVPDPLFEDAGAAKEFVEPATGEACVAGGGGGEDGESDLAWKKTEKGAERWAIPERTTGRKFISCQYVAAHVQLLNIAPERRSRFATTGQVAADGEGSTGPRAQAHAQPYTRAQMRTLKPCSRCKAQRKGVAYCVRQGHISVPVSALRKREGMGGKPQGPRALLLISFKYADVSLSAPVFQEGLDRLSGLRPQLFNGIFQMDNDALRGSMSIGRVRQFLRYNSVMQTQDLSVVQSAWQQTAGWCHGSFDDFLFRFLQLHLIMEVADNGIPLMLVHSRLSFGAGVLQTPWRLVVRTPLDGTPVLSPVVSWLNTYMAASLYVPERGAIGIRELWLSDTACPKFPEQPKAHVSSAQPGAMKDGGKGAGCITYNVGDREQDQGAKMPAEGLFPLRSVTYLVRENEMIQSSGVYGLGRVRFRWDRVGPVDKSCYVDSDLQSPCQHAKI